MLVKTCLFFYSDVLKAWYALQNKNNKNRNVSNVSKNTIIWCNANVRHRGKVLLFEEWIKAGIIYMKDIIVNDRFLNLGELANVVKSPLILFSLHKLINAIPKKWKEEIKTKNISSTRVQSNLLIHSNKNIKHVSILQTRDIYNMLLLDTDKSEPICIKHWEQRGITKRKSWNSIFLFKIKNRLENRYGQFQFNVLYNLIPCKKNLFLWSLSNTDKCDYCNEKENLEHFFMCHKFRYFWTNFEQSVCIIESYPTFKITLEQIICGYDIENKDKHLLNALIIIACFSIYKSRLIYRDTGKFVPISIYFTQELKRIQQTIFQSKKKKRILMNQNKWSKCKVFWNI